MKKTQKLTREEIILKESFKEFLINNNMDYYILDRYGEYPFPNSLGCYKAGAGDWRVYNVTDRGKIVEREKVKTQKEAYKIFATRADLKYSVSILRGNRVLLNLEKENAALKQRFFDYDLNDEIQLLKQGSVHTHKVQSSKKRKNGGVEKFVRSFSCEAARSTPVAWKTCSKASVDYRRIGEVSI